MSVEQISVEKTSTRAAICIIGDEILNGKTKDSNTNYLARFCFDLGVDLKRVEVIPDDEADIKETVRRLSDRFDLVFTSGGIGPTHDDITYGSIAAAYNLPLALDNKTCEDMVRLSVQRDPKWDLTNARKRMATFPSPATILRPVPELWVPVVVVNGNIHILPGIPRLFEQLLQGLKPHILSVKQKKLEAAGFSGEGQVGYARYYRSQVGTSLPEGAIADALTDIQAKVKSRDIKVGSYPKWGGVSDAQGRQVRVVVSVVGRDEAGVKEVADEIRQAVDGWEVTGLDEDAKGKM
ncbi:hypothetical protein BZG36_00783 [Bifiguratus adelaidae]|uniref:MoaB/Mog domain-containing protein n=1 Tax=Bifiguratus adelaidae TaxID=1938954 RepID=A0A261Y6I0_9FUNG|nr:hypothetical protein BZG36_00783 [Bifiguratus adelaidae]